MPTSRAKDMRAVKKLALKGAKPPRMSLDEKRLVRELHFEQQRAPADIARTLGCPLSSVTRLLAQTRAPNPVGRPGKLSEGQKDKLVALLEKMVDEADANHEVTLQMLMRRGRVKACPRVVQNALHERGYWFRDLRERPVLTPEDVKDRYAKAATKLEVHHIPKHSPDLNVMEFVIWSEIERRMRLQERKWPVSRRETRDQFGRRLGRTARSLTASYIDKSVGDLKRRCDLLHAAKGGLFEEGRRRRRPL